MANKGTVRAEGATIPSNEDGTPLPLVVVAPAIIRNGASGTVSVKLPCQPSVNVTVRTTVIDGSAQMSVTSGQSLTFTATNWNTPQSVTLQSVANQAGWQRVLFTTSGVDFPGYGGVTSHVLVS